MRSCVRQREGDRRKPVPPPPCKFSPPSLPLPSPPWPCLPFSGLQKRGPAAQNGEKGFSGRTPARTHLLCTSPNLRACLIMINCHMANQIQFQKVGNDIPRTPGKTQDLSLFPGKKRQVPSLQPPQPFPILTIPNRINTISILFPPPGN